MKIKDKKNKLEHLDYAEKIAMLKFQKLIHKSKRHIIITLTIYYNRFKRV